MSTKESRRVLTRNFSGLTITLGESINVPTNGLGLGAAGLGPGWSGHSRSASEPAAPVSFVSKLPPAVANVPHEDTRAYLHSKMVDKYLVGNTLGEGSFAKVKEGFHSLVGEKVAMKVIDKKKAKQDPYVEKNFRREAKLLGKVCHPNILQLLEVIETENSYYIITELCSGGELMKHIYAKGRLDENETRKFMRQIVSAIDHLHRAGIIHRDLKVENLLLDANMDVRLIDFGLSNEEYTEGEEGRTHCSTQCGSPAYAAPELLGHKDYGPQVDIWSIGVNMYAMLTGCLPYTVEPFNITALHAKMLENKMNPIPENLSEECKDLLRRLLTSNPEERIKMPDIISHVWMNRGSRLPFGPAPYPNTLTENDLNEDIIEYMVHELHLRDTEEVIKREIMANQPTPSTAIYHLVVARLARYHREFKPRVTRTRQRPRKYTTEPSLLCEKEDDDQSTISCPTVKRTTPSINRQRIQLRKAKDSIGQQRERPISDPPSIREPGERSHSRERRNTLPPSILEDELSQFRSIDRPVMKRRPSTLPRQPVSVGSYLDKYTSHHDSGASPGLAPVRPPPAFSRNSYSKSQPHALNQLRHDLKDHFPHAHPVTPAWSSQPNSRVGSRNPSRAGTRNSSTVMARELSTAPTSHHSFKPTEPADVEDLEELEFHPVTTYTTRGVGKSSKSSNGQPGTFYLKGDSPEEHSQQEIRFPTIPQTPSKRTRKASDQSDFHQAHSPHRNGFLSQSGDFEMRTDLSASKILGEILKAVKSLKVREVNNIGNNRLMCLWRGVRLVISVCKDDRLNVCRLSIQWQSGGDVESYTAICQKIIAKIKL